MVAFRDSEALETGRLHVELGFVRLSSSELKVLDAVPANLWPFDEQVGLNKTREF